MRKFLTIFLPVLAVVVVFAGFAVGCKKQSDVTPPKDTQKEVLTEDEEKAKMYIFSTYGEGYKIVGIKAYKLDANLVIPSTYRGKPVVALEEQLFFGHNEIESVVIPDSVTSMGREIFSNCGEIKFVKLSNNLTVIPDQAFLACPSLVSVDMGNGVIQINSNAFAACGNLETVKMSQNLESIGVDAFSSCRSLVSIVIPNGVTSIGEWAFSECTSLVEVWNLSDLQIEAESSNYGGVAQCALAVYVDETEKSRVTKDSNGFLLYSDAEKGEYVLVDYKGTEKNITLPENISGYNYKIRDYAFCSNQDIVSVVIPDGVQAIGEHAFVNCHNLSSVVIPDSVQAIGEWAFAHCYNISSVVIGRGVQEIGSASFYECRKLVEVWNLSSLNIVTGSWEHGDVADNAIAVYTDASVPSKVTKDANGFLLYSDAEKGLYVLVGYEGTETNITLPANIAGHNYTIRDYAFYENDNITSVSIPEAVTSIGRYAFYYCGHLAVVNIPTNLTYIGDYAFNGCYSMNTLNIPNSVTYIGDYAFSGCKLQCITIGSEIEFIGNYAFMYNDALEMIVFDENIDWTNLIIVGTLTEEDVTFVVKGTDQKSIEMALTKIEKVHSYYKWQMTIQIDATLVDLIPNTYGFAAIEPIQ